MAPTTNENPPVADPVVTVLGRTYVVAYDMTAQFKLSQWGIDPRRFGCLVDPKGTDPQRIFYALNCWAACVASNYIGELAPNGEQWAQMLSKAGIDEESPDWEPMMSAVGVALGKRLRAVIKRQAKPAAIPTQEASSNVVQ